MAIFGRKSILIITSRPFQLKWLPLLFRLVAVTLGALHVWAAMTSYSMNADGISYLDIGDAYWRGDWNAAINAVWSPMYSWILGGVMYLVQPTMAGEFPLVHLVNFAIFLVALICFDFFWRQVMRYNSVFKTKTTGNRLISLPEWAWISLGYVLFIWSSLNLIEIWSVTPDMLMAALVYLAGGLIMRIRLGTATRGVYVLVGLVLGLAYLTKSIMFPVSFVLLTVSWLSAGDTRYAFPRVLMALFIFLMLTLPFIIAISLTKGKPTFGEGGKLTYARHVNGVPYPHWQGDSLGNGMPVHPSRKIFADPPVYEFATPINGTYPISYDPSYWYEGVAARFDFRQQFLSLLTNSLFYIDIFFRQQGGLLLSSIILYILGDWKAFRIREIVRTWGLSLAALIVLGMYALVLVEGRYIGVFLVLLWADLFANIRLPGTALHRRLTTILSAMMVLFMLGNIAIFNLQGFFDLVARKKSNQNVVHQLGPPGWPGAVAGVLQQHDVTPGDKVAVIGYGFDSYWARLARVKIIAELPVVSADPFWRGDSSFQAGIIEAFARTGVKAIVAERVPSYASLPNWKQVKNSNYYFYVFDK
jgi:hypothetical protein